MKTSNKSTNASKTKETKSTPVNAIKLLTQDHREVKELFDQYEKLVDKKASNAERKELAQHICAMLTIHAKIEEEVFYPAARKEFNDKDDALIDEADVEHDSAKELIAQIMAMKPSDDHYDAKVKVLGEYITHHVKEEEHEMFTKAKKSNMDLQELGEEMLVRKEQLITELESN
ncbi:MAG: hemerythrin domain-containing protein [Pseudomonadota bacterium]